MAHNLDRTAHWSVFNIAVFKPSRIYFVVGNDLYVMCDGQFKPKMP